MNAKARVLEIIEGNRDEAAGYLSGLLKHPSVMGSEESAQRYYAELLKLLDMEIDIWEPRAEDMKINPDFMPARDDYTGSPDVVGVLRGTGGGRSILLNGHVDVVPAGGNDWTDDPWSGKIEDGKVYGRGANDMKGALIAYLMAMKAIKEAGISLKGDVLIGSVIGEETGGAGTLSLINRGYKADGAIISEPSDLRVCPVSMGVIWFRVRVRGLMAHAATSYLGVNAISKAAMLIQEIDAYEERMIRDKKHPLYSHHPSPFSINIGIIKGGVFPTSVPDEVILEARMSFSPDDDIAMVKKELEETIHKAAMKDEWLKDHLPEVEWYGFCLNSGSVPMDNPLLGAILDNFKLVKEKEAEVIGTPWGTDAGALIRYGNIPTIVFGPGPGGMAHKADEYIDIDMLQDTTKVIAATILDWCGH
ncbi:peptidase [Gudongella oleilytica]|uniref:peptidase n=1 Tax=Gudongella oleilytica TaxID=1582259 RepID=UPI000FF8B580|nr:peptidase [Gudongella oleilytica]